MYMYITFITNFNHYGNDNPFCLRWISERKGFWLQWCDVINILTQKQNSQMPVHPWQREKISTPTGASSHQTIVVSPTITSKGASSHQTIVVSPTKASKDQFSYRSIKSPTIVVSPTIASKDQYSYRSIKSPNHSGKSYNSK